MGNMTPVNPSVEHGVTSEENADLFKALEVKRQAGTLAGARELEAEGSAAAPELVLDFDEKDDAELAKMTKPALLEYMREWSKNADAIAEQKAEHAAKLAERAAIHGIPRGKVGEVITSMLENRADHPGRCVPYPLLNEEGEIRMTVGRRNRKPTAITRQDN